MGQFKLVVIDDEPLIRIGLPSVIRRIAPQWEVVGTAANGFEGLELIDAVRPDLAIIDISMPQMDGIALYAELKKRREAPYCIVLSGHSEFEYVRSMLRMGVLDYLIKPIEDNRILNQLRQVENMVLEDFRRKLVENEQNRQLSEYWVHQLIHGNLYGVEECERQLRQLGIPASSMCYALCAVHFDIPAEEEKSRGTYRFFLFKTAQELIRDNGIAIQGEDGRIVLLLWSDRAELADELVTSFEGQFVAFVHEFSKVSVTVGSSAVFDSFSRFREAWSHAKLALHAAIDNRNKQDQGLIARVKQYIGNNLNNNLSLQNAADHVHMNANYLSEVFKQSTGQNFIDYVIEQRIELAKRLLEDDRLKLYEISQMVGYQSSKHFTALFKKVVGILPSDYKRLIGK